MKDDHVDRGSSVDDLILAPEQPAKPSIDDLVLEKRAEATVTPLFSAHDRTSHKPILFDDIRDPMQGDGLDEDELVLNTIAAPRAVPSHDPFFGPEPQRPSANGSSWRGLLSGIEEMPPQVREQSAGAMIQRLDRAGVRLSHIVKASDLRRIAIAAHHGEHQRRRAIRDVAPSEIQRVSRILETDRDLQQAARSFISHEEADALRVLSMAERAREDAAPRLSAYLLLDAALGATL
jgi:hypothetical protein